MISKVLVDTWLAKKEVAAGFKVWLDEFCEEYSVHEADAPAPQPPRGGKRGTGGADLSLSPLKKAKVLFSSMMCAFFPRGPLMLCFVQAFLFCFQVRTVNVMLVAIGVCFNPQIDNATIVPANEIKQALLFEANVSSKEPTMKLQIRAANTINLLNAFDTELSLTANDQLGGFGAGSFKLIKQPDTEMPTNSWEFKLESDEDMIVLNNIVTTLGKAMINQWKTKPDAKCAYHNIVRNNEDPHKFTLDLTHRVAFVLGEAPPKINSSNICLKTPFAKWAEIPHIRVLWHCRWTQKVGFSKST